MIVSSLHLLAQVTLVSSAAILLVGALRRPLRSIVGARAAYWSWILVPASVLAVFLPPPSPTASVVTNSMRPSLGAGLSDALVSISSYESSTGYAEAALVIWLTGSFVTMTWLVVRQRAFVRSLGHLTIDADGTHRSGQITAPMLVGAWRPRVIVPRDFEARYAEKDRELMLAHERAHQERRDTLVNSIAAAGLCASWFNPLMYWALGRLRFDQELACDALVLSRSGAGRKRYADALLNAQLISDSTQAAPAGCHWQSTHPLKERIAMLKFPSASLPRRLAGIAFAIALAASGMYAVSSSVAQASPNGAESADIKIAIDAQDMDTRKVLEMIARKGEHNILVSDQVGGKITVHLKDVTWREALDIVVQSQGLTTRQTGNITFVDVAR